MKELTRRDLLRGTGALAAGLASGSLIAPGRPVAVAYRLTPWETWQETYTSAFAGDSPPDVSYVVDSFFPKFADAGALVDLGSLEGGDHARRRAAAM